MPQRNIRSSRPRMGHPSSQELLSDAHARAQLPRGPAAKRTDSERAMIVARRFAVQAIMRKIALYFFSLIAASIAAGCGPQVKQISFEVGDVKRGYCKAVSVQPGYFWQPTERVMPCRTDRGQLVFIGQQQSENLLAELSGPVAVVSSRLVIPITPTP
jgi:hypothetical protein